MATDAYDAPVWQCNGMDHWHCSANVIGAMDLQCLGLGGSYIDGIEPALTHREREGIAVQQKARSHLQRGGNQGQGCGHPGLTILHCSPSLHLSSSPSIWRKICQEPPGIFFFPGLAIVAVEAVGG